MQNTPSGAKAEFVVRGTARLKPCPDVSQSIERSREVATGAQQAGAPTDIN
ncbi:MAG TPA: hypothetical protein VJN69_03325 [Candidatus Acidoferrales bacterium]|nr:hypothetical protein [Candidatus Acidoferrales bacterium]